MTTDMMNFRDFVEKTPDSASAQWRAVADQIRPKVPKLAAIPEDAESRLRASGISRKRRRMCRKRTAASSYVVSDRCPSANGPRTDICRLRG